ncbi:MAG: hypothetical protein ACREQ5_31830 [Candidatus Dormibacteria bacterium]
MTIDAKPPGHQWFAGDAHPKSKHIGCDRGVLETRRRVCSIGVPRAWTARHPGGCPNTESQTAGLATAIGTVMLGYVPPDTRRGG